MTYLKNSWAEGSYPPILWRPNYIVPPFSNFVQPESLSLLLPTPTSTVHSVVLFRWLNEWLHHIWRATLVNHTIDVHMSTLRTLMWVLCIKASSLLRCDTWCFFLLVLWFDITHASTQTHTERDTAHPGASRLTIYTLTALCSQQLSLLYWIKNSLISLIYFPQCVFFSKKIFTCKSHICWLECYKTRFFLWNTNNTERNGLNTQNAHAPNTQ